MEFINDYTSPMDRNYHANPVGYFGDMNAPEEPSIESPVKISELGQSVAEGARFGSFIKTSQEAIRKGAGTLELSTNMGGGNEPVGAESYGVEAREALRDLSRVNQVKIVSIHSPTNIGNMSGYNPQEKAFSDEHRKIQMDEVKKAIDFAADTAGQGAVVVHTGEYQRDMSDQKWARNPDGTYKFLSYGEEPGRQVLYLVDDRTGRLITEVRKSMVVHEPRFMEKWDPVQQRNRWIDKEGNFLDESVPDDLFRRVPEWDAENTRFKTKRLDWNHFVQRSEDWNRYYPKDNGKRWTPEEMFFRSQMETRILQSRGASLYHGRMYDDERKGREELMRLKEYFEKIEKEVPVDEQWKILEESKVARSVWGSQMLSKYGRTEKKLPTEVIAEELKSIDLGMKYTHEASSSADAQADESYETMTHVVPVEEYAKEQTSNSYAEAGIYAMSQSHNNRHAKGDIYIAPENIFPEMGYGSHPEELITLVKDGRKRMVEYLTEKQIPDPHGRRDEKGDLLMVNNPHYTGMSRSDAEKEAKQHIKATLDTQHLGMWWKHFQPNSGETVDQRKERFNKWYMEQIDKLSKEDIIGHIHVVDSLGGGHHHLPVGQGDLPVKDAVEYLKKKGYAGSMISEAWGEETMHGVGRILTETWRAFGSPIKSTGYGVGAPSSAWTDVQQSYFNQMQSPYFIFGAYSPSNDWQFWSQVPIE
ncbi:hypothetical protein JXB31_03625 [Candidatus Woesearchaeota archaeon]|nr:hypothetical protein [Candidatus Woesearchaeota archaeon]